MPKLAILIPTYNGASHIEQALMSLANQPLLEYGVETVLLHDDHSTDQTVAIAHACWNNAIPLSVMVSDQNQGLFANHNAGLKALLAQPPEWIFIFHQDDYVKEQWLESMVAEIHQATRKTATIACSYDGFLDDGTVVPGDNREGIIVIPGIVSHVRGTLLKGGWWHLSGCILNVEVLKAVGLFDAALPHMGDWEWTLRCFAHGYTILYVPRTLIGWRQHHDSYSAHSMRTVGYARQLIEVLQRYKYVLSRSEYLRWHGQQAYYALRRTARAVQLRNLTFFKAGVEIMLLIGTNAVRY